MHCVHQQDKAYLAQPGEQLTGLNLLNAKLT